MLLDLLSGHLLCLLLIDGRSRQRNRHRDALVRSDNLGRLGPAEAVLAAAAGGTHSLRGSRDPGADAVVYAASAAVVGIPRRGRHRRGDHGDGRAVVVVVL